MPKLPRAHTASGWEIRIAKWRRVGLSLLGPDAKARGQSNPFTVVVEGLFTTPRGK